MKRQPLGPSGEEKTNRSLFNKSSIEISPLSKFPSFRGVPDGRGVLLMCIQQNKCPFFSLLRILVALSKPTNMKPITIDGIAITPCPKTSLPYNPKFIERAKALRYAQNLPEVLFWMQVTNDVFTS